MSGRHEDILNKEKIDFRLGGGAQMYGVMGEGQIGTRMEGVMGEGQMGTRMEGAFGMVPSSDTFSITALQR